MTRIYTLVNQKGGVGKTTTTINLGAYLAYFGQRVLLVDLDPQANTTSCLGIDKNSVDGDIREASLEPTLEVVPHARRVRHQVIHLIRAGEVRVHHAEEHARARDVDRHSAETTVTTLHLEADHLVGADRVALA